MSVIADDPRTPRVQVADALRTDISSGVYPKGSRLPSVRDLADRFGVSPGTAQAALDLLRQESLIYSAGNRGTFVGTADSAEPEGTDLGTQLAELAKQVQKLADRVTVLERGNASHAINNA